MNNKYIRSLNELRSTRSLTGLSMLLALYTVLDFTRIIISPTMEISFSFVAIAVAGMLYGPACGGIMAGIGDIICYTLRPNGSFFPGFTLNAVIYGIIFGLMLYKKKPSLKNVIISKLILTVIISLILNPIWLSILYGSRLFALPRIIKAFILLPVECIVMLIALSTVSRIINLKP